MRKPFPLILTAVLLSSLLSIGHSLRLRLWTDEGAMASPAITLLHLGRIATMIYEDAGADQPDGDTQRTGVHEHTYYLPPLHFLAQALWYAVVPPSVFTMRLLSSQELVVLRPGHEVRRVAIHRNGMYDTGTACANDAAPKASISPNGRYLAYSCNFGVPENPSVRGRSWLQ